LRNYIRIQPRRNNRNQTRNKLGLSFNAGCPRWLRQSSLTYLLHDGIHLSWLDPGVPKVKVKEVAAMLKAIHVREDKEEAVRKAGIVAEKLEGGTMWLTSGGNPLCITRRAYSPSGRASCSVSFCAFSFFSITTKQAVTARKIIAITAKYTLAATIIFFVLINSEGGNRLM
jgi:hypothetical protein